MSKITALFVLLAAFASLALAQVRRQPSGQHEQKTFPIDYSAVAENSAIASQIELGDYYERTYALHTVLGAWKTGVRDQLPEILPWLDADARILEKWDFLVKKHKYRVMALGPERNTDGASTIRVDARNSLIRINLNRGVYLETDPALLLVGAIYDADFLHNTRDTSVEPAAYNASFKREFDRFFESSHHKLNERAGLTDFASLVWMKKRSLIWQMAWYEKACLKNPMIQRPSFSKLVAQFQNDRTEWDSEQIRLLSKAVRDAFPTTLVAELWNYSFHEPWYDLPQ